MKWMIDVFLPEKVAIALQEAEEAMGDAWERETLEDEDGPTIRRRVAEALISLGRKIDPEADEDSETAA